MSFPSNQAQEEQLQLIEQLRHELARVQVQNSELCLLLTAKQNENMDALTQKLDHNITKVVLVVKIQYICILCSWF